ncbi:hypothetical protein G6F22_021141 [Rhizopus arrhizus]|nr:hypothetical protein G6F22_021141 [Rhizopus arrhizus]
MAVWSSRTTYTEPSRPSATATITAIQIGLFIGCPPHGRSVARSGGPPAGPDHGKLPPLPPAATASPRPGSPLRPGPRCWDGYRRSSARRSAGGHRHRSPCGSRSAPAARSPATGACGSLPGRPCTGPATG